MIRNWYLENNVKFMVHYELFKVIGTISEKVRSKKSNFRTISQQFLSIFRGNSIVSDFFVYNVHKKLYIHKIIVHKMYKDTPVSKKKNIRIEL